MPEAMASVEGLQRLHRLNPPPLHHGKQDKQDKQDKQGKRAQQPRTPTEIFRRNPTRNF